MPLNQQRATRVKVADVYRAQAKPPLLCQHAVGPSMWWCGASAVQGRLPHARRWRYPALIGFDAASAWLCDTSPDRPSPPSGGVRNI